MSEIFDQLKAPFPPDRISWRVGSTTQDKTRGLAFGYIDARDVMERLDEVAGPENWQCRYPHANGKTVCDIGVNVGALLGLGQTEPDWVWKADGAGDSDIEAAKGALSDAFKRAAVRWGIGRYLYDVPSVWVEIEPAGKSYKIKESEYAKLAKLVGGKTTPQKAPPSNAALDSQAVATDMIRELRMIKTVNALRTWGANMSDKIHQLSDADAGRVRDDYGNQLKALKDAENMAA